MTTIPSSIAVFRKIVVLAVAFPTVATLIGCGSAADDSIANHSERIIGGIVDVDTPVANAVVQIGGGCTGTLITSTLVLTAAHCRPVTGSIVHIGLDNRADAAPPSTLPNADRGSRTVTAVATLADPDEPRGDDFRSRDVAVLRIWPPIVSEASPQKPSLAPLPWSNGLASIHMGMAGYGLIDFDKTILPAERQSREGNMTIQRVMQESGFAVIKYESNSGNKSNVSGTNPGDSGMPWYQPGSASPGRDAFAVHSGGNCLETNGWTCDVFGICNYRCTAVAADLTAPAMIQWLASLVDPNGDGRWEGEVDYSRSDYDTTPAPCLNGEDSDCDGVLNHNDNCRHDWNPEQYNSDEPETFGTTDFVAPRFDSRHKWDHGDACDLCPEVPDYGANCNAEAEVAQFGPREPLTESDVVSSEYPSLKLQRNRERYRGDACDPSPCVQLASADIVLDPSVAPVPNPLPSECLNGRAYGGSGCAYFAPARIERKAFGGVDWPSPDGETGYAFCECEGPFRTPLERDQNCFANNSCPIKAAHFRTPPELHPLTSAQLEPIASGNETGTKDVFSVSPTTKSSFVWDFVSDYESIENTTLPRPLTPSAISTIKMTGLIQSNVRLFPGHSDAADTFGTPVKKADVASYWIPMDLEVGLGFTSFTPPPVFKPIPSVLCLPDCPIGILQPWVWVINPSDLSRPPRVVAATSERSADITNRFSAEVLTALTDRYMHWIHASEPPSVLMQHSSTSARSLVVATRRTKGQRTYAVQTLKQNDNGSLFLDASGDMSSVALNVLQVFSGVSNRLYRLGSGSIVTHFEVHDIGANASTNVNLSQLIESPLAMVYNWYDDALYVVTSPSGYMTGRLILSRIEMNGAVTELANLFRPSGAVPYLGTGVDGSLIFAVWRDGSGDGNYRVMSVSVFGDVPAARKVASGQGALAATPFTDGTFLYVARDSRGMGFTEYPWLTNDPELLDWLVQ